MSELASAHRTTDERRTKDKMSTSFMDLANEADILMPDGAPIPPGSPTLNDPGNDHYTTRIDAAGEYLQSFQYLTALLDGIIDRTESRTLGNEMEDLNTYDIAVAARKYFIEVDRRIMYDRMCKRLQRAKLGATTETRLAMEKIIADIEKEFL